MNLISNCCAGGYMYKNYLGRFNNPFIWNAIKFPSLIKLIKEYDSINFNNIQVLPTSFLNKTDIYKVVIDKKIEVLYTHYRYLKNCKCKFEGLDAFRNDAQEYVRKCYINRLQRMQKLNEKPSFLILDNKDGYTFTIDEIIQLTKINTDYKIIFVSNKDLSNIVFPKNMKWIKDNGWYHDFVCRDHHDEIITFFKNEI